MTATQAPPALQLLSDEQMRQFVTHGFVQLKTLAVPRETHDTIFNKLDEAAKTNGHVGNNALPTIPELRDVLDDPAVTGAIASVLGPSAILHQHRFMHGNHPGQNKAPGWHKDSYWGYYGRLRSHRPWWAMIMYYPQDTNQENGPTSVLPGRQHHHTRAGPDDDRGRVSVTGEAGTFFLIHYDIWHAAWPNTSDRRRFMCKFEYLRLDAPTEPTWDSDDRAWREPAREEMPPFRSRLMWRRVWDWCANNRAAWPKRFTDRGVAQLIADLADPERQMDAADELGSLGAEALPAARPLAELLFNLKTEPASFNATYALAAIGPAAVPELLRIATHFGDDYSQRHVSLALGEMGEAALPAMFEFAKSEVPLVRGAAAFALGELPGNKTHDVEITDELIRLSRDGEKRVRLWAVESLGHRAASYGTQASRDNAIAALIERLTDADTEIRFFAPISLARVGVSATAAVPALIKALRDENRYVRGHALEALVRIDSPEARRAAFDFLKASRWCPNTTPASPFYP